MLGYVFRRVLLIIPTMLVISIVVFLVIQLPPGDYVNTMMATMQDSGMDNFGVEALRTLTDQA